jgi:hypothetical protein
MTMLVDTGKWTEADLDRMLRKASGIGDAGARIDFLSGLFLGTAYAASTLIGNLETPETLVVNLRGVDCFTFIDYVEAMRRSDSFRGFIGKLKTVRYRSGDVSFSQRHHFFTDWREYNARYIADVTAEVGGEHARKAVKVLNRKEDGTRYVHGIDPVERELRYIPSAALDNTMGRLRTGDYAGIYSSAAGLDVSHVGIVVRKNSEVYFRHASSGSDERVVRDDELRAYVCASPGLIVFRPIPEAAA